MQELLDRIIRSQGWGGEGTVSLVYFAGMLFFSVLLLFLFVAPFSGVVTWVERRVAARMQSRVGPNRVGPQGLLQWVADGVKCILKEDLIPDGADRILFRMAPYLVFCGMFGAFAVIPFSEHLVIADLNLGVFYVMAITSLVPVGIIMAGWASNNKWSLLGGMRSAAQIVSYEIPSGLGLLTVLLAAGTLSLQGIIKSQGWSPVDWYVFRNPFLFAAFFLFFVSSLAEGNRTPFDLPEAESELVAGYTTEYSGIRFALFMLAEWANLWVIASLVNVLFLGGWNVPAVFSGLLQTLFQVAVFTAKSWVLVFVIIWVRWTVPRVRVDQMMTVCWKYLVPLSFLNMFGTAVWLMALPDGNALARLVSWALFLLGLGLLLLFGLRVRKNLKDAGIEKLDLNPFI
ncbi:MAG: NADH-quinone oxidoreductase subunit NuoH [Candidatus Eisenbacteria bacterium]